ncbi:MAG: hypothetical protein KAJ98_00875 [Spirochaetaceae bacterium]|nr:hypothetical protein [Spirochaetaceae bacterium]
MEIYDRILEAADPSLPMALRIAENDTTLYWLMALEMYREVSTDLDNGRQSVFIVPVGPIYQYRILITLIDQLPIDLSGLHLFFMDEYLDVNDALIDSGHPLSFRGFVDMELADLLTGRHGFRREQVHFPDPADPEAYDGAIADLGGATVCFAGVGINGHLAFNEAPCGPESLSRIVNLTPETITTNAHTALGGAWEMIPRRAVTVGMKSILAARRLSLWMNRPWQRAVARKLLFGPICPDFPASYACNHPVPSLTVTAAVAEAPHFGLR